MTKAKNLATLLDENGKISSEDLTANINITTSLSVGNSSVNTTISPSSLVINGVNVDTKITGNAATAYTNAVTYSSNATHITSGTLNTNRLPSIVNLGQEINIGSNVKITTTSITVGNSSENSFISSGTIAINGVNINTAISTAVANADNISNGTVNANRLANNLNSTGFGTSPDNARITVGSGNTTVAPVKMTNGSLLTTASPGAIEYDGDVFYNSVSGSGRGVVPSYHYTRLSQNGISVDGTFNYFPSALNLDSDSVYEVESVIFFTKTGSGTLTFKFVNSVPPALMNATFMGSSVTGMQAALSMQSASVIASTANVALPNTASLSSGTNHMYNFKALIYSNTTTASTLRLEMTVNSGNVTPLMGSYLRVTKLPTSNVGSTT